MKNYLLLLTSFLLAGCIGPMVGTWERTDFSPKERPSSFTFEKGGKATHVGSTNINYKNWERKGNTVTISGTNRNNGNPITENYNLTKQSGKWTMSDKTSGRTFRRTK